MGHPGEQRGWRVGEYTSRSSRDEVVVRKLGMGKNGGRKRDAQWRKARGCQSDLTKRYIGARARQEIKCTPRPDGPFVRSTVGGRADINPVTVLRFDWPLEHDVFCLSSPVLATFLNCTRRWFSDK